MSGVTYDVDQYKHSRVPWICHNMDGSNERYGEDSNAPCKVRAILGRLGVEDM